MHLELITHELTFKRPARTSRGSYTGRKCHYIVATDETGATGIGECSPLPGLSPESDDPDFGSTLEDVVARINGNQTVDLRQMPAVVFGLETALLDLAMGGRHVLFDSPWVQGQEGIRINGLVWMDTPERMLASALAKREAGFGCVKIKIGAYEFEQELQAIEAFRRVCPAESVELRLDANGAFKTADEALDKLERLNPLGIHSLEQPLPAGRWEESARVCAESPIAIALDEELIRVYDREERNRMLRTIKPKYIILKPTLCGGFAGATEWMALADECGAGYWATSALESNIGLNAIAQWTAALKPTMPQGLGTGSLFVDNIASPLSVVGQELRYNPEQKWGTV